MIKSSVKIASSILLSVLLVLSPVSNSYAFTIGEERDVGEKLLFSIRSAFKVLDDPDISEYINSLGAEVLEVAGIQYFNYRFYVIENKDFNAFAAPSGLIFFHTGLIETMTTEDELLSVLAHEIGHIVKRHLASRIESGNIINVASLAVALASLALGDAKATAALITSSMAAGQSAKLNFSRQHEEEADLLAYEWMKKLHRDPKGQEKMLQTMRRITRYRMGQVPQYLLTHPDPEARLSYVQSLMYADEAELKAMNTAPSEFDFLRFKYRVLSMTSDMNKIRQYLASTSSRAEKNSFDEMMAKYGLSQLDRQEKNFTNGLALIAEVIEYFPDKSILKIDQGNMELEAGYYDNAINTLERAYSVDRNDDYATYSLGLGYSKLGKLDKAKSLFLQVSRSMPEYSTVYYELGRIANLNKERGEASYYLGLYNLYEGKLKLAGFNFREASQSKDLPDQLRKKLGMYKETLERLQKK